MTEPKSSRGPRDTVEVTAAGPRYASLPDTFPAHLPSQLTDFIGRERELGELRQHLERVRGGQGCVMLIAGEPGIGKTRTTEEFAGCAERAGARVLWGRCYEGEGAPAFWPWIQILRSYAQDCDPSALRAEMGPGAADIAELVSDVRERLPDLPAPPPSQPAQARFRLFDSITTFLTSAARRQPLVLILDDLHWADTPSLLLLEFLARELRQAQVLVVGTYRDVEAKHPHPLARTLAELARLGFSRTILLSGLGQGDVAHFIESASGLVPPAGLVAAVAKETDGNPFFVTEIVRLLAAEGRLERPEAVQPWSLTVPPSVRAAIGQRLSRFSETCQRILTIAAVIGRDFGLRTLERVSELSADQLLEVLEEAEAARAVAAVPGAVGRYRFVHALIRETLYNELPSTRRVRLHRQVGEALEALDEPSRQAHLAELAHHFFQAAPGGAVDKAITYAWRAGDSALGLLAYEEAAAQYERALQALNLRQPADQGQRCQLLLALSRALARAGDAGRAQDAARRAAAVARKLGVPEQLAEAALGFEENWVTIGVVDTFVVSLLEEALAALGQRPSALRARVMARLALELHWSNASDRAALLSQEALEMARQVGDTAALASALRSRHYILQGPKDVEQRLGIATEMIRLAEAMGDREKATRGHWARAGTLLELGDLPAFDADLEVHSRLTDELRHPHHQWNAAIAQAMRALLDGRIEESERLAEAALAVGQRIPNQYVLEVYRGQLFAVRREQGRLGELEPALKEFVQQSPRLAIWRCGLALLYSYEGRLAEARSEFERLAANEFTDLRQDSLWFVSVAYLSEVCASLGDARRAAKLYELLLPYAERTITLSATHCCGSAAHYLALLAATMTHWEEAAQHFEAALARHLTMGARLWLAHTQYDYAKMLLARGGPGDREQALPLLAQALATAQQLGMTRLAEQAFALQGETDRARDAATYPKALSAREVEVLRLIAAGQTNKEIAEALVVSVPTVERHIANIYSKINARGRADAATYALKHGLVRLDGP